MVKTAKPLVSSKPAIIKQPTGQQGAAKVINEVSGLTATAKLLELTAGLFSIEIGPSKGQRDERGGFRLPATFITDTAVGQDASPVELFPNRAGSRWLGPDGGTVVVNVPQSGGQILITTYRAAEREAVPLAIQIGKLGARQPAGAPPVQAPSAPAAAASASAPRTDVPTAEPPAAPLVKAEIVLRSGDTERKAASGEWCGNQGEKQRVDAFAIRPLEEIGSKDLEYKALGPNGRETPWVSDAKLCGSKGSGPGLIGFAVRLRAPLEQKFQVLYQGSFFQTGVSDIKRDGEICVGTQTNDPLEALNIRLTLRQSA